MKTLIFSIIAGGCMALTSACTGDTTTVEEQPVVVQPEPQKETVIIREVEKPAEPKVEDERGVKIDVNGDGAGVEVDGKKGTKIDVKVGDPK